VKEYRSHSGIDTKFIFPKAAPRIVATDERMLFVDGLVPRTVYTFNISAYFTDDTWGPVHQIRVETSIGGTPILLPFMISAIRLLVGEQVYSISFHENFPGIGRDNDKQIRLCN